MCNPANKQANDRIRHATWQIHPKRRWNHVKGAAWVWSQSSLNGVTRWDEQLTYARAWSEYVKNTCWWNTRRGNLRDRLGHFSNFDTPPPRGGTPQLHCACWTRRGCTTCPIPVPSDPGRPLVSRTPSLPERSWNPGEHNEPIHQESLWLMQQHVFLHLLRLRCAPGALRTTRGLMQNKDMTVCDCVSVNTLRVTSPLWICWRSSGCSKGSRVISFASLDTRLTSFMSYKRWQRLWQRWRSDLASLLQWNKNKHGSLNSKSIFRIINQ